MRITRSLGKMYSMRQQRNVRTKGLRDESKSNLQECEALAYRINMYSVKQGKNLRAGETSKLHQCQKPYAPRKQVNHKTHA